MDIQVIDRNEEILDPSMDLITKCDNAYQLSDNLLRLHLWILSGGSPAELIIAQTSDKA